MLEISCLSQSTFDFLGQKTSHCQVLLKTQRRGTMKRRSWRTTEDALIFQKKVIWVRLSWHWGLSVPPSKITRASSQFFLGGGCVLARDQSDCPSPHGLGQEPSGLDQLLQGSLLDSATLVSLFQLLLYPFFEYRCRRLRTVGKNFGIWQNSPAAITGTDQQVTEASKTR